MMKNSQQIREEFRPYFRALPVILNYQVATKLVISIWLFVLGKVFQMLLRSSGRVAVTSGDWKFLFTTWQGILILLLGLASLFIYFAFDLNAKVVISRNIINGEKASIKEVFNEGFLSVGKLINIRGILVIIYIALIAPVLGFGISVSVTHNLYIPTFISSFIESSVLYSALAGFAVLLLLSIGVANLFILHGIIIDKLPIGEAGKQSRKLIRTNWKDYFIQNIRFILIITVSVTVVAIICLFLPLKLITSLPLPAGVGRVLVIFFVIAGVIISALADMFCVPLYLLKMTQLFYSYKQGSRYEFRETEKENLRGYKIAAAAVLVAVIAAVFFVNEYFDQLFPVDTNVMIIAHRAGGNEGRENTISGLDAAWSAGAYGSEIDIQRTKDGYYIVNHDATFKRVAGDDRKPGEMTMREIRKLSIDGEPVPTLEEMILASKGRLVLFIELKGESADIKMADDAAALIRQYHMEDECVLISLKYDVIDYIETNYPEIQTGFLTFASFGNTAGLNCDYIGLEEESATADAISAIHDEGKKVLVWTANEIGSQRHFLCTDADGLITDNVSQAVGLATELGNRSDLDRMIDRIKTIM